MSEYDLLMTLKLNSLLKTSEYSKLKKIDASCVQGTATLSGVADSYWTKQMAQVVARRLPGIQQIRNQISVESQNRAG